MLLSASSLSSPDSLVPFPLLSIADRVLAYSGLGVFSRGFRACFEKLHVCFFFFLLAPR